MANQTIATITSSDGRSEVEVTKKDGDLFIHGISLGFFGGETYSVTKDGKYIGSADTREEAISKAIKAVN